MKTFNQFKEDYEKRGKAALRNIGNKTIAKTNNTAGKTKV